MTSDDLGSYFELVESFIIGGLPVDQFVSRYLSAFLAEKGFRPDDEYEHLNNIFGAAECFRPDAREDDPYEVTEAELRQVAVSELAALRKLR